MKIKIPDTGDVTTNALLETAWKDGADSARTEVLTWLEREYVDAPITDEELRKKIRTPKQEAILELARELGIFIRSHRGKDAK